jgi:hypothetical protein
MAVLLALLWVFTGEKAAAIGAICFGTLAFIVFCNALVALGAP